MKLKIPQGVIVLNLCQRTQHFVSRTHWSHGKFAPLIIGSRYMHNVELGASGVGTGSHNNNQNNYSCNCSITSRRNFRYNYSIHKNSNVCKNYRKKADFSAIFERKSKMAPKFNLDDYDWIGFDLDNTLGEYHIFENAKLEFELLAKFLIDEKGYEGSILAKPFEDDTDFLQKGLMFDICRGNIVKIGYDGTVLRVCHGTKPLSDEEIMKVYGSDRKWDVATEYCLDPLSAWEGPTAKQLRTLLDYFDISASLVFARAVDAVDIKLNGRPDHYTIWPDLLEGLTYLYSREHFQLNKGGYFPTLKSNPQKFIKKCTPQVLKWLKELKKTKKLFVITGSNIDYASFTASQSLGEDWQAYFDIRVFYSRKPGFFTGSRPFIKIEGITETDPLKGENLQLSNDYSQGNWQELYTLFSKISKKKEPKCLYIGDNLVQDVFTPSKHTNCDTIALSEELSAESDPEVNQIFRHEAVSVLKSNLWGSYFYDEKFKKPTLWSKLIHQYSKICIPNLEVLTSVPINHSFDCFTQDDVTPQNVVADIFGYYPFSPASLYSKKF